MADEMRVKWFHIYVEKQVAVIELNLILLKGVI